MVDTVSLSRSSTNPTPGNGAGLSGGGQNNFGNATNRMPTDTSVSQLESLQGRSNSGVALSAVEQGTLARLQDARLAQTTPTPSASSAPAAKAGASAGVDAGKAAAGAAAAGAAAAKPKGAVTVADLKLTNATDQDKADLKAALEYLQRKDSKGNAISPTAVKLLEGIRDKGTTINFVHDGGDAYTGSTNTIDWDPKSGLQLVDNSGKATGGTQSAALGLAHEADHAVNGQKKITVYGSKDKSFPYGNSEEKRVITGTEARIAKDFGEPLRTNHNGEPVTLGTSTEFTAVPKPPAPPKK